MDISTQINGLKKMREETPAVAIVPSGKSKMYSSANPDFKMAKQDEFRMKPVMFCASGEKKKSNK